MAKRLTTIPISQLSSFSPISGIILCIFPKISYTHIRRYICYLYCKTLCTLLCTMPISICWRIFLHQYMKYFILFFSFNDYIAFHYMCVSFHYWNIYLFSVDLYWWTFRLFLVFRYLYNITMNNLVSMTVNTCARINVG